MSSNVLLPYLFKRYGHHNVVRLIDPDLLDVTQPFFSAGVAERTGHVGMVGMMGFDEWLSVQPDVGDGFSNFSAIFHVSRCGSTLLANNIRASGQAMVLSEPPFFRILRHRMWGSISADVAMRACLAMLNAWRGWAQERGMPLVVKFGSQMHLHHREVFDRMPAARFIFLHREPGAVLESLQRKPPPYLQAERSEDAIPQPLIETTESDPVLIAAVRRYCAALDSFASLFRDNLISVRYEQLSARYAEILVHLGLDPEAAPSWCAQRDAKAAGGEPRSLYIPVSPERLARFSESHNEILAYAALRYQTFLKDRGAASNLSG